MYHPAARILLGENQEGWLSPVARIPLGLNRTQGRSGCGERARRDCGWKGTWTSESESGKNWGRALRMLWLSTDLRDQGSVAGSDQDRTGFPRISGGAPYEYPVAPPSRFRRSRALSIFPL